MIGCYEIAVVGFFFFILFLVFVLTKAVVGFKLGIGYDFDSF